MSLCEGAKSCLRDEREEERRDIDASAQIVSLGGMAVALLLLRVDLPLPSEAASGSLFSSDGIAAVSDDALEELAVGKCEEESCCCLLLLLLLLDAAARVRGLKRLALAERRAAAAKPDLGMVAKLAF